jgi:hypothetical protein
MAKKYQQQNQKLKIFPDDEIKQQIGGQQQFHLKKYTNLQIHNSRKIKPNY